MKHSWNDNEAEPYGRKGGLLRFLAYFPMSVSFTDEGFPEPETKILISDYYFLPPFLYEAGAILGRVRHDKLNVLRKMLHTASGTEYNIEKVFDMAKKRLEEHKRDNSGKEPQTFSLFILCTEYQSKTYWLDLNAGAEVSLSDIEPYILSLVLEGIVFGTIFPELTEKMNRKFYDSIEVDWDTWTPFDAPRPLMLPKHIYALPGEPTILSLEGQEQTLLQVVGWYTANLYPELVESLNLGHYREDEALIGHRHYSGWWRVYDTLLLSGKGAL